MATERACFSNSVPTEETEPYDSQAQLLAAASARFASSAFGHKARSSDCTNPEWERLRIPLGPATQVIPILQNSTDFRRFDLNFV